MLEYFSQNVTVAGAEKLQHASKLKRITWSLLLLTATGFCLFHLHNRLDYYFQNPITVSMHTEYRKDGMPFPAITICTDSLQRSVRSFNCSIALEKVQYGLADVPECDAFNYDDPNWFLDAWITQQANVAEYLRFCVQQFQKCPVSSLKLTMLNEGRLCLKYNDSRKVSMYGFPRNFVAAFDTNVNNSSDFAIFRGYNVFIHDPEVTPNSLDSPILMAPGVHTSVTIHHQKRVKLPSPYESKCRNTTVADGQLYNKMKCIRDCTMARSLSVCDCAIRLMINGTIDPRKKVCTMKELGRCFATIYGAEVTASHKCSLECPEQCTTLRRVITSITTGKFHGKGFLKWAQDPSMGHDRFLASSISNEYAEKNIASISIQYDDLSTEVIEQIPAYTWLALMADLGGALGLGMGACLITIVQLFDVLFTYAGKIKVKNYVRSFTVK